MNGVLILASKDMDGICSAEVLSRYFRQVKRINASIKFIREDELEFAVSSRLILGNTSLAVIGFDLPSDTVKKIHDTWKEPPGVPVIWSSEESSRRYVLAGESGHLMRRIIGAFPGEAITPCMCRVILGRQLEPEQQKAFEREYERYAELEEGAADTEEAVLFPKVYDPYMIYTRLCRENGKPGDFYGLIKDVLEVEKQKCVTAVSNMDEVSVKGVRAAVTVVKDSAQEPDEWLVVKEYFRQGGEAALVFRKLCRDRLEGMMRYVRLYFSKECGVDARELLLRTFSQTASGERSAAKIIHRRGYYEIGCFRLKKDFRKASSIAALAVKPALEEMIKARDAGTFQFPTEYGTGTIEETGELRTATAIQ